MDAITTVTTASTYLSYSKTVTSASVTGGQTAAAATPSAVVELGTAAAQNTAGTYGPVVEAMKKEAETRYQNLRDMVRQLLYEQYGISIPAEDQTLEIPQETVEEAKKAIGEGGYYSPENTATRIMDFAKALSGGDASKFNLLKDAVEKGFAAASEQLGGKLPDISNQTYDLVQQKFAAWAEELGIAA